MNEEMLEATIESQLGKPVFVYWTPPNTQMVQICISGHLIKNESEHGINFQTIGIGCSIAFTAKSVERVTTGKNIGGQECLFIYLKTTEEWQRENT